jgi:hypothetical protein
MEYFLTRPMMVLAFKDNHQEAVTLPTGKLIDVVGPVEDDDRFVRIRADGEFHVFASDLADGAKQVGPREKRGLAEESPASEPNSQRAAHK